MQKKVRAIFEDDTNDYQLDLISYFSVVISRTVTTLLYNDPFQVNVLFPYP